METNVSRRDVVKGAAATCGLWGLAALTGCTSTGSGADRKAGNAGGTLASGTYAASAAGMRGELTVFVTIDGDKITNVTVDDPDDTPVIKDAAIESIAKRIVDQQNIEVDTVAGATMTSMGILNAVAEAVGQAGDGTVFKKGSDAVADKKAGPVESCDVVVVGSGMAGMSAALGIVLNSDKKVVVLEKQAYSGGSTRVCGGGIWTVNGPVNKTIGQDCSKEDYISFMQQRSAPAQLNVALMGNMYDVCPEAFARLYNWGLPLSVNSWNLGNSDSQLPCIDSTANVGANWETGNSGLADFLTKLAISKKVDLRLNSRVTKLIKDGEAVTGVEVETLDSTYTVNAGKVILATGGFTRNPDLVKRYAPEYVEAFPFTGSGSTGDGHMMAEEIGATVIGNGMMGLTGINPSLGYYGPVGGAVWSAQITVNAEGEEFGMKGAFYADTLALVLKQTNSCGYGICDSSSDIVDRLEEGVAMGAIFKYDTLDELAESQKITVKTLKQQAEGAGIAKAPFFCIPRRPLFIGSIPGLKVDDSCRVLDAGDEVIGNLYAAGEIMFANAFDGAYPASGSGIGTSCYAGALAARTALA